ncbi:MAG TPA: PadR family transcriptional regulator [Candidatus Lokiarchaeia archaeon]|nr:PadR family transcriptional regulator [Candidatus Lokiarchaeia archaeon]
MSDDQTQFKSGEKISLSSNAVIVMGLLAESPAHPYELNQKIEMRGYRDWTEIGFSSIYSILKTLEKQGLVDVSEAVEKSRTRTIYKLTPLGQGALVREIKRILVTPKRPVSEWDLGLAYMFRLLSYEEQIEYLEARQREIRQEMEFLVTRSAEFPRENIEVYRETYHIKALFDHPIYLSNAELAFIDDLIAGIRSLQKAD